MVRWLQHRVSPSLAMIGALACAAGSVAAQPQAARKQAPLPSEQMSIAPAISLEQAAVLLRTTPRPALTPLPLLNARRSSQIPSGLTPPDTARRSPARAEADTTLPNIVDLFPGKSQGTVASPETSRATPQDEAAPQAASQATATSTAPCAPTTGIAEIAALTRALRCDANLIYEYVYNNIETLPIHGGLKGPLGTLLDGKGTAFDIADLTTILLRGAGYDADIAIGTVRHEFDAPDNSLSNWLQTDVNENSIGAVLSGGYIPVSTSSSGFAYLGWAWVRVSINGADYLVDPATKLYTRSSGLPSNTPLVNLMGYDRDSFFSTASSASSNATTVNAGQINRNFIRTYLGAYAGNLASNLPTFAPGASTAGVIGGKSIVPLDLNRSIQNADMRSRIIGNYTLEPTIPNTLRAIMTVRFQNGEAMTVGSSDAYGRRLSLFVNASNQPVLMLDGADTKVGPAVACDGMAKVTFNISISRPMGFGNQARDISVPACTSSGKKGRYIISNGWGPVGRSMIEKHRNLLQARVAQGEAADSEGVLGESLAILGFTWLAERARIQTVINQIAGVSINYFHGIGIVGIGPVGSGSLEGPFVDLPINSLSFTQRINHPATNNPTPLETAAFFTNAGMGSILESGSIEQTQAPSQLTTHQFEDCPLTA